MRHVVRNVVVDRNVGHVVVQQRNVVVNGMVDFHRVVRAHVPLQLLMRYRRVVVDMMVPVEREDSLCG